MTTLAYRVRRPDPCACESGALSYFRTSSQRFRGILASIAWQWVFLFNVPFGIFGTFWGAWRLREPVALPGQQQFDWPGTLVFTFGVGALLLGLSMVAFPVWGPVAVVTLMIVGMIGLIVFIAVESRSTQPMMNLRLFGNRLFALANLANLLNGIARGAVLFLLIFFLQGPYGQDPLSAGIMMAPFGIAFMLFGPLSGYLSDRYGSRGLGTGGLLISAVALAGLALITDRTPFWQLAALMAVIGAGAGLFNSPNVNVIMTAVRPDQRGTAAGQATPEEAKRTETSPITRWVRTTSSSTVCQLENCVCAGKTARYVRAPAGDRPGRRVEVGWAFARGRATSRRIGQSGSRDVRHRSY